MYYYCSIFTMLILAWPSEQGPILITCNYRPLAGRTVHVFGTIPFHTVIYSPFAFFLQFASAFVDLASFPLPPNSPCPGSSPSIAWAQCLVASTTYLAAPRAFPGPAIDSTAYMYVQ
ncbi:hypothetical protein N7510_005033 [Penicillium lagena]|uniref:uncharacterized protein n=1 Tax=Penicillium lagena TaxID=94218 RepID=UPI00254172A7|nr:uncharacterized protein N7510_005033 [Penicillium lagena]KAJ5621049.1 hypothetical protein N7510_005033 [Penicillium lagena]